MSSKEGSYLLRVLPPLLLRIRTGSFLARLDVPMGLNGAGGRGAGSTVIGALQPVTCNTGQRWQGKKKIAVFSQG